MRLALLFTLQPCQGAQKEAQVASAPVKIPVMEPQFFFIEGEPGTTLTRIRNRFHAAFPRFIGFSSLPRMRSQNVARDRCPDLAENRKVTGSHREM